MTQKNEKEPLPERPTAAAGGETGYCVTARASAREQIRTLLDTMLAKGEKPEEGEIDFLLATASGLALKKLGEKNPKRSPLGSVALKIRDAVYYVRIAALFNVVRLRNSTAEIMEGPEVPLTLQPEYRRRLIRLAEKGSQAQLLCSMVRLASQLALSRGETVFRFRWMMTVETKTGRREHHPIDFDVEPKLWFGLTDEQTETMRRRSSLSASDNKKSDTKGGRTLPIRDRVRRILLKEGALRENPDGTVCWTKFGRLGILWMIFWSVMAVIGIPLVVGSIG